MLEEGVTAPEFTLQNQNDEPVSLSEYRGQQVVLYFYPAASTRGCSIEARGFRDAWDAFDTADIAVIGVSIDSVEAIKTFSEEESLPFTLLSDADGTVAKQYDVYDAGVTDGDPYEIATRTTYIIGEDGTIETTYADVSPEDHANVILDDLDAS